MLAVLSLAVAAVALLLSGIAVARTTGQSPVSLTGDEMVNNAACLQLVNRYQRVTLHGGEPLPEVPGATAIALDDRVVSWSAPEGGVSRATVHFTIPPHTRPTHVLLSGLGAPKVARLAMEGDALPCDSWAHLAVTLKMVYSGEIVAV